MKKRWIFALLVGAATVAVGMSLISKRGKGRYGECFPEYCGTCGDDEIMKRECENAMDMPTLLHNRGSV